MWGWLPRRRTDDEKRADVGDALWELLIAVGVLTLGLAMMAFSLMTGVGVDWLFFLGALIAFAGGIFSGQALLGLVLEISIGMAGMTVVLVVLILGFAFVQGYTLLTG
ncbi:hypothetical protein KDD17_08290 [Sulfitobacter albidus]|uniref:Uncharacterized protein n=1 Tax=Sulfitobacter albidus TaxID=2829501 RepID=A0A975JAU0_9RHOB|nr:hypothetical protein [Sulfitobacter albidus]QUJ75046.1 hypothetical protein KDD17_08290 [Sulfitobacter albidus]